MAAHRLPVAQIAGRHYFRDDRLREYRAVDTPHERLTLDVRIDQCASCGADLGPSTSYPWHSPGTTCRDVHGPIEGGVV